MSLRFMRSRGKAIAAAYVVATVLVTCASSSNLEAAPFARGDADGSGALNVSDAVVVLAVLYRGVEPPIACDDAFDANDDGRIDTSDVLTLLGWLFLRGTSPPEPFERCGEDPTEDGLGCESHAPCEARVNVFVIDRSPSGTSVFFDGARRETISAIESLGPLEEFAVIFFDRGILKFPFFGRPITATTESVKSAAMWINSVNFGSGTCLREALLDGLATVELGTARNGALTLYTDGFVTCPGQNVLEYEQRILADVTDANAGRTPLDAVAPLGNADVEFLSELVSRNGGIVRGLR